MVASDPLSDAPNRRSNRSRRAALIAPAVLVTLCVGAFLAIRAGAGPDPPGPGPSPTSRPSEAPATFSFILGDVVPVGGTAVGSDPDTAADEAASQAAAAITRLYSEAFLRPENWRSGTFVTVWPMFDADAADAARTDVEVLTAGTSAGDRFAAIDPSLAELDVEVLTLEDARPTLLLASVRFAAIATETTGETLQIVSSGDYFLRRAGDGWRVVAFRVDRDDRPITSVSGSPTAEAP